MFRKEEDCEAVCNEEEKKSKILNFIYFIKNKHKNKNTTNIIKRRR